MEEISLIDIAKRHNLSQMEQIMLAYDLTFENYPNDGQKYNINNEFINYLKCLNINSVSFDVTDFNNKKHNRLAIYVKDKKYNLNGIYFFDLVKASYEGYELYNSFGKSKLYFDDFDKKYGFKEEYIGDFLNIVDLFYDIAQFDSYDEEPKQYIDSINHVSEIVEGKSLNLPYCNYNLDMSYYDILEKINGYDLLLFNEMYLEDLIRMYLKVSKVKYLEGLSDEPNIKNSKDIFKDYSNFVLNPSGRYELYRKKIFNSYMYKDFYHKKPLIILLKDLEKGLHRSNLDYVRKRRDNVIKSYDDTIEKVFAYYMSKDNFYQERYLTSVKKYVKTKKCN